MAYVLLEETKAQWRSALGHVCARIKSDRAEMITINTIRGTCIYQAPTGFKPK